MKLQAPGSRLQRKSRFQAPNKLRVGVLIFAVLLVGSCSKKPEAGKEKQPDTEKKEPESRVSHDTNGNVVVTLDAATQKTMALEVTPLKPATLQPEIKAYGRVLDVSTLAAGVADLATAHAASQASQAELQRVKTLAAQTNASTRALQAAEATAIHDQSQVEALSLRLLTTWGGALVSRQNLTGLVQSLGNLKSALVEVDLPAGEAVPQPPVGARLVTLSNQGQPIRAEFLGPSPTVDSQVQGRGFLFLVESNSLGLAPGAAVTGYLEMPGEPQQGVAVPASAVLRQNGATWVYLQISEEKFQRTAVSVEKPLEGGWFVRQGLKTEDKVVTAGAQELLSEELKGGE